MHIVLEISSSRFFDAVVLYVITIIIASSQFLPYFCNIPNDNHIWTPRKRSTSCTAQRSAQQSAKTLRARCQEVSREPPENHQMIMCRNEECLPIAATSSPQQTPANTSTALHSEAQPSSPTWTTSTQSTRNEMRREWQLMVIYSPDSHCH